MQPQSPMEELRILCKIFAFAAEFPSNQDSAAPQGREAPPSIPLSLTSSWEKLLQAGRTPLCQRCDPVEWRQTGSATCPSRPARHWRFSLHHPMPEAPLPLPALPALSAVLSQESVQYKGNGHQKKIFPTGFLWVLLGFWGGWVCP